MKRAHSRPPAAMRKCISATLALLMILSMIPLYLPSASAAEVSGSDIAVSSADVVSPADAAAVSAGDVVSCADLPPVSTGDADADRADDAGSGNVITDIDITLQTVDSIDGYEVGWDGSENYLPRAAEEIYEETYKITFTEDTGLLGSTQTIKVFIPIPKEGDEWGVLNSGIDAEGNKTSTFAYNTVLDTQISWPTSEYGYNTIRDFYGHLPSDALSPDSTVEEAGNTLNGIYDYSETITSKTNYGILQFKNPEPGKTYEITLLTTTNDSHEEIHDRVNIMRPVVWQYVNGKTGIYTLGQIAEKVVQIGFEGLVWSDLNGNGIQDDGEPGIPDVAVKYDKENLSVSTDENGRYCFEGLGYTHDYVSLSITPDLENFVLSPRDAGEDDKLDSDAELTDTSAVIGGMRMFHKGQDGYASLYRTNADFGLIPYVSVSYSWVGSAPAAAELPEGVDKILSGSAYDPAEVDAIPSYTFDGWYTDEECTKKHEDGDSIIGETTLYGKWTHHTVSLSGSIEWDNILPGSTAPDMIINLMQGGTKLDSVTVSAGTEEFSFTALDRYDTDGSAIAYTIEVEDMEHYDVTLSAPVTDARGNITIDISAVGDFTYGNLEISNKVTGTAADTTLRFSFKVELSAGGSYEYKIISAKGYSAGENALTVKSGDTIQLSHGQTAVISGIPAGTAYKVTETDKQGYTLTSTGDSGTITENGARASFINEKNKPSTGSTPDTGDSTASQTIALYVMQLAVTAMLMCIWSMKNLRREKV